MFIFDTVVLFL